MDRELSPEILRKEKIKNVSKIGIIIVFIFTVFVIFRNMLNPAVSRANLHIAVAGKGPIEATVTASGTVVPEFEQMLTSPVQSRIDSVYHRPGEKIKSGTSIVSLNKEYLSNTYSQLTDELELKCNKKTQLKLQLERHLIDLQTQLEIKELQIQSLGKKLDQETRLYEIGGGSRNEMDKAALDLEVAKKEHSHLQLQIQNQKESLKADLKELELEIHIQEKKMNDLRRQLELAEAKAERDGVITWVNEDIGSNINQGDVVARIADLTSFKVEAKISDMHAARLNVGNPVNVRINDTILKGTITTIRPTIENGIITFLVNLEDKQHSQLRSNLRVDVFVITSYVKDVVRVKNGPFINGSGEQDIFIIKDNKAIRKTVIIGATNFDYAELKNEVEPGDEVIISNMSEYIHHSEIDLK